MQWSKVKKRVEATFADCVRGRVEIWATRYRESHDAEMEIWITIDGERVWSMGALTAYTAIYSGEDPEGIFDPWRVWMRLEGYLNTAFD